MPIGSSQMPTASPSIPSAAENASTIGHQLHGLKSPSSGSPSSMSEVEHVFGQLAALRGVDASEVERDEGAHDGGEQQCDGADRLQAGVPRLVGALRRSPSRVDDRHQQEEPGQDPPETGVGAHLLHLSLVEVHNRGFRRVLRGTDADRNAGLGVVQVERGRSLRMRGIDVKL